MPCFCRNTLCDYLFFSCSEPVLLSCSNSPNWPNRSRCRVPAVFNSNTGRLCCKTQSAAHRQHHSESSTDTAGSRKPWRLHSLDSLASSLPKPAPSPQPKHEAHQHLGTQNTKHNSNTKHQTKHEAKPKTRSATQTTKHNPNTKRTNRNRKRGSRSCRSQAQAQSVHFPCINGHSSPERWWPLQQKDTITKQQYTQRPSVLEETNAWKAGAQLCYCCVRKVITAQYG